MIEKFELKSNVWRAHFAFSSCMLTPAASEGTAYGSNWQTVFLYKHLHLQPKFALTT